MFSQRVIIALLLLPFGIAAILFGGWPFFAFAALVILLAAAEFLQLFLISSNRPAQFFVLLSIFALFFFRWTRSFALDPFILPFFALLAMLLHLLQFERGREQAASEFAISLSAFFYVGLLGSYAFAIRSLELGQWWLLLIIGAPWIADMGAYFIGRAFGRHKMLPGLSPKKSWEGYLGGILFALLLTPLYARLMQRFALPESDLFATTNLLLLALLLSVLPPMGDFGISMIKRQFNVKHTGSLLRGHGGMLDRLDSIFWALPLGYLLVTLLT